MNSRRTPGASRTCRPAGSWGLRVVLVSTPLIALLTQPITLSQEASKEGVTCPRCAAEGKIACKRCGGTGKLTRPCRRCDGTGERPCLQCNRPGEDREIPPGQVACDYCGGRGTLGKQATKPCPQCAGAALVTCPSCGGKAVLACQKERVVGICPDCRLTGKVTCTLCDGEGRVRRAVLDAASAPNTGESPSGASSSGDAESGGDPSPTGNAVLREPDTAEIVARFHALARSVERHDRVFADNLHDEITATTEEVRALTRDLRNAPGPESTVTLRMGLRELEERLQHFRARWEETADLYERLKTTFESLRAAWAERAEGSARPTGLEYGSPRRFDPLALRLAIAEKLCEELDDEKPEWMLRERKDVQSLWEDRRQAAEGKLEEIRAAEAAREAAAAAEKRSNGNGDGDSTKSGNAAGSSRQTPEAGERATYESGAPFDSSSQGTASRKSPPSTNGREASGTEREGTSPPASTREDRRTDTVIPTSSRLEARSPAGSGSRASNAPEAASAEPASEPFSRQAFRAALWIASVLVTAWLLLTVTTWLRRRREWHEISEWDEG